MKERWNPRYEQYARAHGLDCQAMLDADYERWPGGRMAGYMLWVNERWQEFCAARGYRRTASGGNDTVLGQREHADFDAWLVGRVNELRRATV